MADLHPVQYLFQLWELLVWWMHGQDGHWVRALGIFRTQKITAKPQGRCRPLPCSAGGRDQGRPREGLLLPPLCALP